MQLAFCLYKYFPYGGLQRDFLRIALACQARGHGIRVYALDWQGEVPAGFELVRVPVTAWSNHGRYEKYQRWVQQDLGQRPVSCVVGFNKMPGLDVYYAADPCFAHKAERLKSRLYRRTARYRHFAAYEQAVFDPGADTQILVISPAQQPQFTQYYGTPASRFHLLPPGIATDRRAPANAAEIRADFRREFGLDEDGLLLLQIGSGFRTKGVDRSLLAMAALPDGLRQRSRFLIIGQDDPKVFRRQADNLGLARQVEFLSGRDDVPRFLLGADLLIHPAYSENTGTVLLEALVAGLPVLTTAVCGYAHYIQEAQAGLVVAEPFEQGRLNALLARMLEDKDARGRWQANALAYAETADIYSLHSRAADLILARCAGGHGT